MKGFVKTIFLVSLIVLFMGCKQKNRTTPSEHPTQETIDSTSEPHIIVADTISYGVEVKSKDTSNTWQKKWLRGLKREKLVDLIFENIYAGNLQPYSYFDEQPLSKKDIKKLEKTPSFDRSKIGKIQFTEIWYFNPEKLTMTKDVHAMMLAYERYNTDGSFRGYKPAFKVYLNQSLLTK